MKNSPIRLALEGWWDGWNSRINYQQKVSEEPFSDRGKTLTYLIIDTWDIFFVSNKYLFFTFNSQSYQPFNQLYDYSIFSNSISPNSRTRSQSAILIQGGERDEILNIELISFALNVIGYRWDSLILVFCLWQQMNWLRLRQMVRLLIEMLRIWYINSILNHVLLLSWSSVTQIKERSWKSKYFKPLFLRKL